MLQIVALALKAYKKENNVIISYEHACLLA